MARASMLLPVPGSPMRIMCRFWVAAFFATSTASSWPMTCSSRRGGTSTFAVDS